MAFATFFLTASLAAAMVSLFAIFRLSSSQLRFYRCIGLAWLLTTLITLAIDQGFVLGIIFFSGGLLSLAVYEFERRQWVVTERMGNHRWQ